MLDGGGSPTTRAAAAAAAAATAPPEPPAHGYRAWGTAWQASRSGPVSEAAPDLAARCRPGHIGRRTPLPAWGVGRRARSDLSGLGGMAATWASRTMTATDPFATGPCGSVTPDARWKASHRANKATLAEPWVPNDASTARTDLPHHGQCWPRPQAPPCGLWHPAWMQQRTPPTSRLARWTRVQATPVPRQSCWPAGAELQLAGLGSTPQVLLPTGAWPLRGSSQDSANRRQYGGQPVPRRFTTATNQPG